MLPKLLLSLLAACLVVQVYAFRDEGTVTMCQEKGPCTCHKTGPKLDCHKQLNYWRYKNSTFVTPSKEFYPTEIDLSYNDLNSFDSASFLSYEQRRHVEVLNLAGNRFSSSENFKLNAFENLRVLNLSHNGLALFENPRSGRHSYQRQRQSWPSIQLFETLEVLDLTGNNIGTFPNKLFSEFKKLKTVILDDNHKLNEVESYDYKTDIIEELSINNCNIRYIQDSILMTVPALKKLWARHNNLRLYPNYALRGLKKLEFLDLSHNMINDAENTRLYVEDSYSMQTILLSHNNLYEIPAQFFENIPNLAKLDLSHNDQLTKIDANAFGLKYQSDKSVCKLRELNLEGSPVETLPKDLLDWSKLTSLKLNGTHLACDTDLGWLISDISVPIEKDVKCYSPPDLKGRRLRDVKKEELQSPVETAVMNYVKQVLDLLTKDPALFYFGLGVLASCAVIFALKCCYCTLCCCVRRTDRKLMKLKEEHDRRKLLEYEAVRPKPQEEDTQTVVSTIPDE